LGVFGGSHDVFNSASEPLDQAAAAQDHDIGTAGNDATFGHTEVTFGGSSVTMGNAEADLQYSSSSWTGQPPLRSRSKQIRSIAPTVLSELDFLIESVEARRLNDPATADALNNLRALHADIGALIEAIDADQPVNLIIGVIARHRDLLIGSATKGAKIFAIAPALTLGIAHLLGYLSGTTIDSSMVSTVYATLIGADVLSGMGLEVRKRSDLSR
jgi:hypothetical protein